MALFKQKETNFGGNLQASYHRIENPVILGKNQISFSLVSFFTDPLETAIEPMAKVVIACGYDIDSPLNPFQQGYEYIKSLPEWENSVDC